MLQKQIVTINGKTYQLRESVEVKKKQSSSKMSGILATMMLMSGMNPALAGMSGLDTKKTEPFDGMNILTEFELIEQKKSKLPSSQRDSIERTFHRQFYEVFVSPEYLYIIKIVRKNTDGTEKIMYYNAPLHQLNFDPEVATRYIDGDDPRYQQDMKKLVNSMEGDEYNAYPIEFETELNSYLIKNTEL